MINNVKSFPPEWDKFDSNNCGIQPDWNQNDETAADYVKNRTHYEEVLNEYVIFEGTLPNFDTTKDLPLQYAIPSDTSVTAYYNGSVVATVVGYYPGGGAAAGTLHYGFSPDLDLTVDNITMKASVYNGMGDGVLKFAVADFTVVHPLDKKYIPDDIARVEDIPIPASAEVGQTIVVKAVDDTGKPTAWQAVDMPSGGGGHWETVLDTVWEQDVINPTAFDSETGIFTCDSGELNNLELNKEYVFFPQCIKEGVAYNTILGNEIVKVTKLSDTTFSIDVTPPTTFVPTNVKFSKGACLAVTDIDAKKIRLTLDGQFKPTATRYNYIFYGAGKSYFGENVGYIQLRNAYQAYQQVTAEVESPYRIVGKILCGFNAPSNSGNFHFKNNSFCSPLVPHDVPEGNERRYALTTDGTKIANLYSTSGPWVLGGSSENTAVYNDFLKIISGTKVKLERWVE